MTLLQSFFIPKPALNLPTRLTEILKTCLFYDGRYTINKYIFTKYIDGTEKKTVKKNLGK